MKAIDIYEEAVKIANGEDCNSIYQLTDSTVELMDKEGNVTVFRNSPPLDLSEAGRQNQLNEAFRRVFGLRLDDSEEPQ